MAKFQETGQEPMEVDEEAHGVMEGDANQINMETGDQVDVHDHRNGLESSQSLTDRSEGNNEAMQDGNDQDNVKTDPDNVGLDQNDVKSDQDEVNINQDESKSDQDKVKSSQDKVEIDQNDKIQNDEVQTDQSEVKNDQDEMETNQDEAKTDQAKEPPSTPPHTINASANSQATEIIGSDSSHGSQASDSDGDNKCQTASDKDNKQPSSEDEAEDQYGSDTPGKKRKITIARKPSVWSTHDTVAYRKRYPGKKDDKKIDKNLKFYRNEISSYPHGDYIDKIHEKWWGNYQLLEYNHSYIQWLFPIREQGLNMHAEILQLHEAKAICSDPEAHGRILKSYKMMLDFYGMKLCNERTGDVERAENWKERFRHLNHSMHNYLRITRILKCLGEMKLEHLKAPFVRYVLHEIISEQTLYNCLNSCINYWLQVIRSDQEREDLLEYAESLAKETRTTTVAKTQAKGETATNTEPSRETQAKKEAQLAKEMQSRKGKDKSQTQPKKQTQSKLKLFKKKYS